MNAQTLRHMSSLVGRVCSIITSSMNRAFDETIAREHFVVRIQEVNADGIWGTHPYNEEMVSFFSMPHIISLHTEIELDLTNPEHKQLIEEYQAKTGQKVEPDVGKLPLSKPKASSDELLPVLDKASELAIQDDLSGDATFVDIANLEQLADQTRRMFDAQDLLAKK